MKLHTHSVPGSFLAAAGFTGLAVKLSEHGLDWPTVVAAIGAVGSLLFGLSHLVRTVSEQAREWVSLYRSKGKS